jgi:hypothetical protein
LKLAEGYKVEGDDLVRIWVRWEQAVVGDRIVGQV